MIDIKLDKTEVDALFKRIKKLLPNIEKRAITDITEYAHKTIPRLYLRGPRPKYLVSGQKIMGGISGVHKVRAGGGGLEPGLKHSIEHRGNEIYGLIYSTAKSKRGFDYPAYWEYSGRAHKPNRPRSFLRPLLEQRGRELFEMFKGAFVREYARRV